LVQETIARAHHASPAHIEARFGGGFDLGDTMAAIERFRLPVEDIAQVRQPLFWIRGVVSLHFAGKARAILRAHCGEIVQHGAAQLVQRSDRQEIGRAPVNDDARALERCSAGLAQLFFDGGLRLLRFHSRNFFGRQRGGDVVAVFVCDGQREAIQCFFQRELDDDRAHGLAFLQLPQIGVIVIAVDARPLADVFQAIRRDRQTVHRVHHRPLQDALRVEERQAIAVVQFDRALREPERAPVYSYDVSHRLADHFGRVDRAGRFRTPMEVVRRVTPVERLVQVWRKVYNTAPRRAFRQAPRR